MFRLECSEPSGPSSSTYNTRIEICFCPWGSICLEDGDHQAQEISGEGLHLYLGPGIALNGHSPVEKEKAKKGAKVTDHCDNGVIIISKNV